jgi:Putative peptidoglycan binding domain
VKTMMFQPGAALMPQHHGGAMGCAMEGSMTSTLTFYDAAYPPDSPPVTDGVCFYIGGNTPHVWTVENIAAQKARYRLPIFVRSDPTSASATVDVVAAVTQLHVIGAPRGCLVAWDTETADNPLYISGVYRNLTAAGYTLIVYGSQSIVAENQNPNGLYWGADWTGSPHLHGGDAMTQYVSFTAYDESDAKVGLPFWDTKAVIPSPISSIPAWQEQLMESLPVVEQGATGDLVRTIQGLCCARGHTTAIDGSFGAQTTIAVRDAQSGKVTVDGIVGSETWPVLITGGK